MKKTILILPFMLLLILGLVSAVEIVVDWPVEGFEHIGVCDIAGNNDPIMCPHIVHIDHTIANDGRTVTATVGFKNYGDTMFRANLLEMQVVPKGGSPFGFFDSVGQQTCDPNHPENVHIDYLFTAGEEEWFQLSTYVPESLGDEVDVYLLTANGCAADLGANFETVPPFKDAIKYGTLNLAGSGDGGDPVVDDAIAWQSFLIVAGLAILGGGIGLLVSGGSIIGAIIGLIIGIGVGIGFGGFI